MEHVYKACAYIPVPKGTDMHSLTKKCQLWRVADFFHNRKYPFYLNCRRKTKEFNMFPELKSFWGMFQ